MHDCRTTQEELIDLVFDEQCSARLRAEVEACADCCAAYRALRQSLDAFDQAVEAMMPEEVYWAGYERRLRERLAADKEPKWRTLLTTIKAHFDVFSFNPNWAMPATAGCVLLVLVAVWWFAARPAVESQPHGDAARATPALTPDSSAKLNSSPPPISATDLSAPSGAQSAPKKLPEKSLVLRRRALPVVPPEPRTFALQNQLALAAPLTTSAPLLTPDLLRHFEQAQILLRSFRNIEARNIEVAGQSSSVAYEQEQSRELLYRNIVLRRDAEAAGNLPVAEVLGSLEPVLLDIKNLPDRPAVDDLCPIKETIRRAGLVGVLSVYTAQSVAVNDLRGRDD